MKVPFTLIGFDCPCENLLSFLARRIRETKFILFVPAYVGGTEINIMRLDKYLKVSRLIKRRTVANEACDGGRVSANGKVVKASYDVKVGDVIEIRFGSKLLKIKVTDVREQVGKSDAATLYEVMA